MSSSKFPTSSDSAKIPDACDILVIGDSWVLDVFAAHLGSKTTRTVFLSLPDVPQYRRLPTYLGNGELAENAILIFGERTASRLWGISRLNMEIATKIAGSSATESKLLWFARTEREQQLIEKSYERNSQARLFGGDILRQGNTEFLNILEERCLLLDTAAFFGLSASPDQISVDKILTISQPASFSHEIEYRREGTSGRIKADIVIVLSERVAVDCFPSLNGKFIPVSLSSFLFTEKTAPPFGVSLFNSGADFAVKEEEGIRLGSFRNLYEDRGVGNLRTTDSLTEKSVRKMFSGLGWIRDEEPLRREVAWETVTCDGLPLVGELPECPGVYIVGGFGGKTQNFIFAVAQELRKGILGGSYSVLDIFSTKRFL